MTQTQHDPDSLKARLTESQTHHDPDSPRARLTENQTHREPDCGMNNCFPPRPNEVMPSLALSSFGKVAVKTQGVIITGDTKRSRSREVSALSQKPRVSTCSVFCSHLGSPTVQASQRAVRSCRNHHQAHLGVILCCPSVLVGEEGGDT